jgi:osmotically-inducible protein OsmY
MQKLCLILLVVLTGCSPTTFLSSSMATLSTGSQERGFGGYITDGEISTRLNLVLFRRDFEMYQQVNVHVYEGRVLLTGNVPTPKIKEDVVKIVWQIPGVKSVMDETIVAPMRTFAQYIKDKWITTRIETALLFDQTIKSRNYDVHTQNGIVYITGMAQGDAELQRVLQKSQSIKGVVRVVAYVRTINPLEAKRNELMKNSWDRSHGNSPSKTIYREKMKAQMQQTKPVAPTEKTEVPVAPSETPKSDNPN